MNPRRPWGLCLAAALAATLCQQAQAQIRRPQGQPKPQAPQPVETDGTVVSVQGGMITLSTRENKTMMAGVSNMTSVRVTGPATVDALLAKGGSHSKMCVEFVADLAEDGKAKAPISRLAIITAGPGRPMGLLPESAAFQPPSATGGGHGRAGGGGGGEAGGMFAEPTAGKGHGKSRTKQEGDDLGLNGGGGGGGSSGHLKPPCVCTVRGTVKGFHGGTLSVNAGKTTVTADVADNAQIGLDLSSLSDLSIVSRGDKIQLRGQAAARPDMVRADSVEITLAQPFSGGGRKHTGGKAAKPEKPVTKAAPTKKAPTPAPAEKAEKKEEPAETPAAPSGDGPKAKSKPKVGPDDEY